MSGLFSRTPKVRQQLIPMSLVSNKLPRRLVLEISLVSWFVPLLNMFLSPQKMARMLDPRSTGMPPQEGYPTDLAGHVGRLLQRRARWHRKRCISRSYLLYRFLRRFGYPAILNFGLMGDHREEGHCWITINDEVFFDETSPEREFLTQVAVSENVVYWI